MHAGSEFGDSNRWIILNVELSFNSFWEEIESEEDDSKKNDCLENRHAQDVLDHFSGNNVFSLPIWWSFKKIIFWCFSSKSKRSKGVHDHIYPKELDSRKR